MKRFRKIYVEISNKCNLSCTFCPGTRRGNCSMTEAQFGSLLPKLQPYTDYLYFHILGEPLCHPKLDRFLALSKQYGFKVILTTNGTLLPQRQELLLSAPALHKVHVSLHAFEANDLKSPFEDYLKGCINFGKAAEGKKITVYRLWNEGGQNDKNQEILEALHLAFPGTWVPGKRGTALGKHIFLEPGEKFDWPDLTAPIRPGPFFCYGLRDQLGVLADGTVVPCCLDHDGDIALGNAFQEDLADVLASPRAKAIYDGFSRGKATEELCRRCGYAERFVK